MSDLVDVAAMREMAEGCGWTLAELADRYVNQVRRDLGAIDDASDSKEQARLAHSLAGASATVGATGMAELFRAMETAARAGARVETVEAKRKLAELAAELSAS